MIQIQSAKPLQVIAFDDQKFPIVASSQWSVKIDDESGNATLTMGRATCVYNLNLHTLCLTPVSTEEEVAIGGTLGRMALTGLAFGFLRNHKKVDAGIGGALLDLSARGSEKRSVIAAYLVFNDTTAILLYLEASEFLKLTNAVPSIALSSEAADRAKTQADLVKRMVADGGRVLGELDEEVSQLALQLEVLKKQVENGASFELRDTARREGQQILIQIESRANLRKAVEYWLRLKDAIARNVAEKEAKEKLYREREAQKKLELEKWRAQKKLEAIKQFKDFWDTIKDEVAKFKARLAIAIKHFKTIIFVIVGFLIFLLVAFMLFVAFMYVKPGHIPDSPILSSPKDTTFPDTDQVSLIWLGSEGAYKYSVQLSSDPDFTNLVSFRTGGSSAERKRYTEYEVGSLKEGRYYWRVSATSGCMRGCGTSKWSEVSSFDVK